ncbi:MAG: protoporphyrinogen oxidase, partial [Nitrospirae bacterium]|nr:protoporphyrinogen oxidase [Nitrospirota bacterium]
EKDFENGAVICGISRGSSSTPGFTLTAIQKGEKRRFLFDRVVLATPAYVSSSLIEPISEAISDQLNSIHYAPVVIVNLGFPLSALSRPFAGSGCLIPKKENRSLLGFRINSNLYQGRAPSGMMVVTSFAGGVRNQDIIRESREELIQTALDELTSLLGLKGKPEFFHTTIHPKAIPQYDLNHSGKIETINRELKRIPGLYLAGNYSKGVSVWDCLSQGLEMGKMISRQLKEG